jgi:hypothetical protein
LPLQPDDIIYVPFRYLRNFSVQGSGIAVSVGLAVVYRFQKIGLEVEYCAKPWK